MPSQFVYGKNPSPPDPTDIDLTRRYDIYLAHADQATVVYRNAAFIGVRTLLSRSSSVMHSDPFCQYIELELANGQTVFVNRHEVRFFCEPGAIVTPEIVFPKPVA
jgi:hypothetical protein